jgi:transcription termination/antitermination protein NusG
MQTDDPSQELDAAPNTPGGEQVAAPPIQEDPTSTAEGAPREPADDEDDVPETEQGVPQAEEAAPPEPDEPVAEEPPLEEASLQAEPAEALPPDDAVPGEETAPTPSPGQGGTDQALAEEPAEVERRDVAEAPGPPDAAEVPTVPERQDVEVAEAAAGPGVTEAPEAAPEEAPASEAASQPAPEPPPAPAPVAAPEPEEAVAGDPFAGPGDWYVIHTYAGYENKVKTNLGSRIHTMQMQDKIFDVVIPMEDVMEIKGGRKQVVQKKVFPGYLLVKMTYDDDSWYVVRNTPGVTGFVSSGTGQKPTPLSRREVEKILAVKKEEAKPAVRLDFEEGDVVRIVSGPFADFNGTIDEINVDQSKVKVLVNIFDRETPVELSFDQVARV